MRILATCSSLSVFCCFSPPRSKFYLCLSWCWKLIPPCLKGGRRRVFLVHFSLYWCVLLNHTWNFNLHFNKAEFVFRWCGAHSGRERGLPILYYHEGTFYITAVLATTSEILFQFNQNKLTLCFSSDAWNRPTRLLKLQKSWLKCLTSQESIFLSAISLVIQVKNQASWLPLKLRFKLQPSGRN